MQASEKTYSLAMRSRVALLSCILSCLPLSAQTPVIAARQYVATHKPELTKEFSDFLAISNVAADPAGLKRNADLLVEQLKQRGVDSRLLSFSGAPDVVYGQWNVANARHTIVFYAHYDGQPVTPSEWDNPPFTPVLREVDGEQRIYARSAGDDKAAIFAQLTALGALKSAHISPRANIRFVWEGEEEAGSPHLEQILNANRDLVHGDVWLVCDGPLDQSGKQTVVFGARGDTHLEVTVYGPHHGLHSGHYGNWAPNPAMMLAQLLAGMKDEQGRALIPHFYDGVAPLSQTEKDALAQAPVNDQMLMASFWLGHVDGSGKHLLELINQPSLNINGFASGQIGARATNVIPPTATADIDLRLVAGIDWQNQQQRVIDYIQSRGYFVVETEPTQEILGGSVPLGAMERAAQTQTITVPIANYDDNQHAANENLRLQNLWDGIETMAALLQMP